MKYILSLLLWAHLSMGQILKPKQEALIRNTIASQFGWEIANSRVLNLGRASFCKVGKDTLYNLAGFHYVFKLVGDSAIRLDKSKYHGSDFRRYIFEWRKNLYSLGGYGMFQSNNILKYFNTKTNEWTYKPVKGDIPMAITGISFIKDSTLYSFNNFISGNNMESDKDIENIYTLNLNSFEWKKKENKNLNFFQRGIKQDVFYLYDFILQLIDNRFFILDFINGDFYLVPCEILNFKYNDIILGIDKNKIITKNDTIEIIKNKISIHKAGNIFKTENHFRLRYLILLIILIVIILFFFINKYKNLNKISNTIDNKFNKDPNVIELIYNSDKNYVTVEELDVILQINHLEINSLRLKRHRILKEVEKHRPGLITRIKDVADKRKFKYQINKK